MQKTIPMLALSLSLGCPKSSTEEPPTPPTPPPGATTEGLVLVEAELATRMQNDRLRPDEFCEVEVPRIELRRGNLEMKCGLRADSWRIAEETTQGTVRTLKTAEGKVVKLEEQGRGRFRVSGGYCDRAPTYYVEYPEANRFRERWLRNAQCPTEDMKLAP